MDLHVSICPSFSCNVIDRKGLCRRRFGAACVEIFAHEPKLDHKCAALQSEMLNGRPAGAPALKSGQGTASEAF
jgi:hypothetical protein